MRKTIRYILPIVLFLSAGTASLADWKNTLLDTLGTKSTDNAAVTSRAVSELSNDEMIAGLKEALVKGTKAAVNQLGKEDGFLGNMDVKIPMPGMLRTVESSLRSMGQDAMADQFIETMNRAAEKAVPVAADVFADSVGKMTIEDARGILTGPDDAATQYFRRTTSDSLREKFLPIVKQATDSVGLTAAYKAMIGQLGPLAGFMDTGSLDLDGYVTDQAMDGLFFMVAAEEKKIRENPVARTTDLLQKVFGSSL